ncbi:MAG: hypothetical protein ABW192_01215, partial [Sphingobium sp.]
MPDFRSIFRLVAASLVGMSSAIPAPATAQTRVENVATFSFRTASGAHQIESNRTTLDMGKRAKRPTTLEFRRFNSRMPPLDLSPQSCEAGEPPRYTPYSLTDDDLADTSLLETLAIEDPWIVVLDNPGGNHDSNMRETSWITARTESRALILVLTETSADSGIFSGSVPPSDVSSRVDLQDSPCNIHTDRSRIFSLEFTEDEFSEGSTDSLLIDPLGYAFDSVTGAVLDGVSVTIVDDATGLPAPVLADDGVSAYPSTVMTGRSVTDAGGATHKLDAGRFRFPLMPIGTYRLVVSPPPGYRAPSNASRAYLATLNGPTGKYNVIDASFGRRFTLSSPEPLFVDIPLDPDRSGPLLLEKTASTRTASPGDTVQYRLRLTNRDTSVALPATTIADNLPVGLRFRKGSTRGAAEPQISGDGRSLTFAFSGIPAGRALDIRYMVEIAPGAPTGEAINRAQATTIGGVSNEASASVRIKPLLFSDATTIIGRVTEGDCADPLRGRKGVPGVRLMLEDGTLVTTDRDGLYHFEGVRAGTHVVQIDRHSVAATHEPVACDKDTRAAGSAISRFVEASGGSLQRVDFQLRRTAANGVVKDSLPIVALSDADAAGGTHDWLKGQAPGIDWLFPAMDHNPRAPALRVVIKHRIGQKVALRINGTAVDAMSFDGSDEDDATGVAISTWTAIPLTDRDNILEAQILNPDGSVAATLDRTVHYGTAPVRAEYLPAASRLIADGLVKPLVAIRLTDRDGRPVRAGTLIGFTVDQPYAAAFDADVEAQRQLAGRDRSVAVARVTGDDGIAFIALQPTTQGGSVHLTALLDEKGVTTPVEFRPWLAAAAQDWTVVGFGKGTIGYNRLRARSTSLPRGEKGGFVTDGELKFYAKGRIKGSWLMTIAYDSDRAYDLDRGLLGTIDPDRYYTVYGDGARQTYDAATSRKLYLRLERREFRALFGDFETGMTETHLTRYSRTLNGVKAEYQGRRLTFTGFAAKNDQLYGRDEIQGTGLSGPYRLSGEGIVPNSDKVRIETRDRVRPEKIVATRQLTRHIDYDIDADAGTLRFREPVLSRDLDSNPIFIVAEYETAQGRSRALVAGARVATRMADGRMEVGASLLRDESVRSGTVAGLDMKARIGAATTV